MVKAKKTYKKGGKVVAQGADKKDVRRENKQDRKAKRAKSMEGGGKVKPMRKKQFPSNKERAKFSRYIRKNTFNLGMSKKEEREIADAGRVKLPKSNAPKPTLKTKK